MFQQEILKGKQLLKKQRFAPFVHSLSWCRSECTRCSDLSTVLLNRPWLRSTPNHISFYTNPDVVDVFYINAQLIYHTFLYLKCPFEVSFSNSLTGTFGSYWSFFAIPFLVWCPSLIPLLAASEWISDPAVMTDRNLTWVVQSSCSHLHRLRQSLEVA